MQVLIIMIAVFTLLLMIADPNPEAKSEEKTAHSAWQEQKQRSEGQIRPSDDVDES